MEVFAFYNTRLCVKFSAIEILSDVFHMIARKNDNELSNCNFCLRDG